MCVLSHHQDLKPGPRQEAAHAIYIIRIYTTTCLWHFPRSVHTLYIQLNSTTHDMSTSPIGTELFSVCCNGCPHNQKHRNALDKLRVFVRYANLNHPTREAQKTKPTRKRLKRRRAVEGSRQGVRCQSAGGSFAPPSLPSAAPPEIIIYSTLPSPSLFFFLKRVRAFQLCAKMIMLYNLPL
jgi:hypothetical protein